MPELVVEHLSKQFPTRSEPLVVLRDISLELSSGQNLAIVGPSGSGKSTLLHILGTLDRPTSGHVELDGQDPFTLNDRDLATFRNRRIGFVFQDHYLLPQLTARENVLIPGLAEGKPDGKQVQRAEELLEKVGLADRADHRPAELSGGERQRVAIARALVHNPTLLLADEPTGNLDRTTASSIGQLLVEVQKETVPPAILIVVTHSTELASSMHRYAELDGGVLVERTGS